MAKSFIILTFHRKRPPYAAMPPWLQEGIGWTTPEEIQKIPLEFYLGMGLQQVLTGQRLNGVTAVLAHMKALSKQ